MKFSRNFQISIFVFNFEIFKKFPFFPIFWSFPDTLGYAILQLCSQLAKDDRFTGRLITYCWPNISGKDHVRLLAYWEVVLMSTAEKHEDYRTESIRRKSFLEALAKLEFSNFDFKALLSGVETKSLDIQLFDSSEVTNNNIIGLDAVLVENGGTKLHMIVFQWIEQKIEINSAGLTDELHNVVKVLDATKLDDIIAKQLQRSIDVRDCPKLEHDLIRIQQCGKFATDKSLQAGLEKLGKLMELFLADPLATTSLVDKTVLFNRMKNDESVEDLLIQAYDATAQWLSLVEQLECQISLICTKIIDKIITSKTEIINMANMFGRSKHFKEFAQILGLKISEIDHLDLGVFMIVSEQMVDVYNAIAPPSVSRHIKTFVDKIWENLARAKQVNEIYLHRDRALIEKLISMLTKIGAENLEKIQILYKIVDFLILSDVQHTIKPCENMAKTFEHFCWPNVNGTDFDRLMAYFTTLSEIENHFDESDMQFSESKMNSTKFLEDLVALGVTDINFKHLLSDPLSIFSSHKITAENVLALDDILVRYLQMEKHHLVGTWIEQKLHEKTETLSDTICSIISKTGKDIVEKLLNNELNQLVDVTNHEKLELNATRMEKCRQVSAGFPGLSEEFRQRKMWIDTFLTDPIRSNNRLNKAEIFDTIVRGEPVLEYLNIIRDDIGTWLAVVKQLNCPIDIGTVENCDTQLLKYTLTLRFSFNVTIFF